MKDPNRNISRTDVPEPMRERRPIYEELDTLNDRYQDARNRIERLESLVSRLHAYIGIEDGPK